MEYKVGDRLELAGRIVECCASLALINPKVLVCRECCFAVNLVITYGICCMATKHIILALNL